MTRDEWLGQFAAAVGLDPPTPTEAEALLELAGVAARGSERAAAPLTCWLVAKAGVAPSAALALAARLAAEASDD